MSKQHIINSLDFARSGKVVRGKIGLADLTRLHDYLHNLNGIIEYTLSGSKTGRGEPLLILSIQGDLELICQRCLDAFKHPLAIESRLKLVKNESELPDVEEEDLAIDNLIADTQFDVLALLEEEIILQLPIAARHAIGECKKGDYVRLEDSEAEVNPAFAALSNLKKSSH
jgi:uncharacterized protein